MNSDHPNAVSGSGVFWFVEEAHLEYASILMMARKSGEAAILETYGLSDEK
jgi:hypothetical protein